MKTLAILLAFLTAAAADEKVTLIAKNTANTAGQSEILTLGVGDSAQFEYGGGSSTGPLNTSGIATIAGTDFTFSIFTTTSSRPLSVAGPATIKLTVGGAGSESGAAFATFNVHRAGTASGPVPIPQEAGTTWQVILEASSDLVNWSAVTPGDFPSSTPQRYFRTRLVRKP
jgi:hypothetical protein